KDLMDPLKGTALDLLRGASALVGPRTMQSHTFDNGTSINFRGYDTTQSPLLDMLYGFANLLEDANLDETISVVRQLVVDHESESARLMEAIMDAADLGQQFPEAGLYEDSAFFDDLVEVAQEILAVPGLAEDLIRALEDPSTRELAQRFADFM